AGRPAVLAAHLPEGPRREDPLVEGEAAHAQGVLEVLARAGAVAIERDGEGVDSKFGHRGRLPILLHATKILRWPSRRVNHEVLERRIAHHGTPPGRGSAA